MKNLIIASVIIAFALAGVIFLTQSLRFLELVIESGASSVTFWILSFLALPRFLEVILPLSLMAAVLFTYNRMTLDSELVVARAAGLSPLRLSRPAIFLSLLVSLLLLVMMLWGAPTALSTMQKMQQDIRAQFSGLLFREGVFNQVGSGLMLYIRERDHGEMKGLLIHDSRDPDMLPSTIIAQRGEVTSDDQGYQVTVFDGTRHQYNAENGVLQRLNFDRYGIEFPASDEVRTRWREPEERTINELLHPDPDSVIDQSKSREFNLEIHRRFSAPFLCAALVMIGLSALLIGPVSRRGQAPRMIGAVVAAMVVQGGYLSAFNMAQQHDWALFLMYGLLAAPLTVLPFLMSGPGERLRRRLFYNGHRKRGAS